MMLGQQEKRLWFSLRACLLANLESEEYKGLQRSWGNDLAVARTHQERRWAVDRNGSNEARLFSLWVVAYDVIFGPNRDM